MVIFGIDPGYAIVGWGVINNEKMKLSTINYGAITTEATENFTYRLEKIYDELSMVISHFKPDVISLEKLFFHTNQKTVIDVAQARGVISLCIQKQGKPVYEYTPLQVKSAVTGYGRASKAQVMEMTKQLLKLEQMPKYDDTSDALALAICHAQRGGMINKINNAKKHLLKEN